MLELKSEAAEACVILITHWNALFCRKGLLTYANLAWATCGQSCMITRLRLSLAFSLLRETASTTTTLWRKARCDPVKLIHKV